MKDSILTPLTLPCGQVISNRLCKAAMTERLSNTDYSVNQGHINLYEMWAKSNFGLHLSGNILVDKNHLESAGNLIAIEDRDIEGLKKLVSVFDGSGAQFWAQLSHAGRQTSYLTNLRPLSASGIWLKRGGFYLPPRAMKESEIEEVIQKFATSASICAKAGFSGIQVHAAHGYLLSQFLSPITNRRNDQWGGSLENRAKLLIRVIDACRKEIGPHLALSVKLNSTDFQKGGFNEEDAVGVIEMLENKVDLLEISGGTYEKQAMLGEHVGNSTAQREAYFLDFAQRIISTTKIPLMVTGGFRKRGSILKALDEGILDMVGIARPFCTTPELMRPFLDGEVDELKDHFTAAKSKYLRFSSAGGYYAKQIIELAKRNKPIPDLSGNDGGKFLMLHESRKAMSKRLFSKRR